MISGNDSRANEVERDAGVERQRTIEVEMTAGAERQRTDNVEWDAGDVDRSDYVRFLH